MSCYVSHTLKLFTIATNTMPFYNFIQQNTKNFNYEIYHKEKEKCITNLLL